MTFKVSMVFKDGSQSSIAEPNDTVKSMCLSDPIIKKIVQHFLKEHSQTQGLVVMWGKGEIQTINVIDATKQMKDEE